MPINVIKGALTGLQHALKGKRDKKRTKEWLRSSRTSWKYVYLTEPDIILHTKPWVLPQLKDALDQGLVLTPHWLQPLPHEADFSKMKDKSKLVPATGNFSSVMELNALNGGVCCDENKGTYKPWEDFPKEKGSFWRQRGFFNGGNHERLTPYSLIRLNPGTGIVSLAASAHGRRCYPRQNGVRLPD